MGYVENLSFEARKKRKEEILERYRIAETPVIQEQTTEERNDAYYTKAISETADFINEQVREKNKTVQETVDFNSNLRTTLITECFMKIFNESMDYSEDQYDSNIARSFISNYIKNEGNSAILNRMKNGSALLSEMAFLIEEVCEACSSDDCEEEDKVDIEKVIADRDKFEKKYRVTPEIKDDFFNKLNNVADVDDVSQSIQLRVGNAMSEFINNTADKKRQIDDTVEDIKSKITADTSEELKEAYQITANRRIDQINNNGYINLFGKLVTNLSESVYKNDDLKREFCENGKTNMDKVIKHVKSLYSVLEIFNTTGLEKFTADKIEEIVDSYTMN